MLEYCQQYIYLMCLVVFWHGLVTILSNICIFWMWTYLTIIIHHYLLQHNFVTGNKIQLVSKINGRALQVAKTDDGGFIVNGAGDLGPTAQNGINLSNIKEIVNLNKKRLFCHYKWNARIKYILYTFMKLFNVKNKMYI